MELESVHDFLKGKTIFVTGATGFLAKLFVEKILRVQPNIKKLYLLLRAANPQIATQRLHDEVIAKDLFGVLREIWGADFGSFISEKVLAVAGDVSLENLGLDDLKLREKMWEEIDIIIHTAANTNFHQSTVDVFVVMYGKGTLSRSLGRRNTIIDAIPADMVINSMIIALEAHSKSLSRTLIYHIGSSLRNPFRMSNLEDSANQYFTKNPLIDQYGKPVAVSKKVTWISSVTSFHRYIKIRYVLPLMV